jgi:hypothetical protein
VTALLHASLVVFVIVDGIGLVAAFFALAKSKYRG